MERPSWRRWRSVLFATVLCASFGLSAAITGQASEPAEADASSDSPKTVRLGVLNRLSPDFYAQTLEPTLQHLKIALPSLRFVVRILPEDDLLEEIKKGRIDFSLLPVNVYSLSNAYGVHYVATRHLREVSDPGRAVGVTLVRRTNEPRFPTLAALSNAARVRLAAPHPKDIAFWSTTERLFRDPDKVRERTLYYLLALPRRLSDAPFRHGRRSGRPDLCVRTLAGDAPGRGRRSCRRHAATRKRPRLRPHLS